MYTQSISIDGTKKLYCYFQHHDLQLLPNIGGAKGKFFCLLTTVNSQEQLFIVARRHKKKHCLFFSLSPLIKKIFSLFSLQSPFSFFLLSLSLVPPSSPSRGWDHGGGSVWFVGGSLGLVQCLYGQISVGRSLGSVFVWVGGCVHVGSLALVRGGGYGCVCGDGSGGFRGGRC